MFRRPINVILIVTAVGFVRGDTLDCNPCECVIDALESTTLYCSRKQIDTVPDAWPKQFLDLDISNNVLITFDNASITNLTSLPQTSFTKVALSFKGNNISDIGNNAFQNVSNLFYLDLSNNRLKGEVMRSEIFQGPYHDGIYDSIGLEILKLGYNEIHSIDRYLFKYTPNLTRLYLNNNPFGILDAVTISALSRAPNLEVLDLSYIEIKRIPLDAFRGLGKLKDIDLSGNKFTIVPESLRLVGATLEYLTFNDNLIVELADDSFLGLENLKELEVSKNAHLEEVKRSSFSELISLKTLHLCHNPRLSHISHMAFGGLKEKWTLKEIYLDDNNLSELPSDLLPWSKMEIIGMTGNSWLCDCDLANIVIRRKAGEKFKPNEIPMCIAPYKLSGEFLTSIPIENCPELDGYQASTTGIKAKHFLWGIFGVAMIAVIGMVLGLFVNFVKKMWSHHFVNRPVPYMNLNTRDNIVI